MGVIEIKVLIEFWEEKISKNSGEKIPQKSKQRFFPPKKKVKNWPAVITKSTKTRLTYLNYFLFLHDQKIFTLTVRSCVFLSLKIMQRCNKINLLVHTTSGGLCLYYTKFCILITEKIMCIIVYTYSKFQYQFQLIALLWICFDQSTGRWFAFTVMRELFVLELRLYWVFINSTLKWIIANNVYIHIQEI